MGIYINGKSLYTPHLKTVEDIAHRKLLAAPFTIPTWSTRTLDYMKPYNDTFCIRINLNSVSLVSPDNICTNASEPISIDSFSMANIALENPHCLFVFKNATTAVAHGVFVAPSDAFTVDLEYDDVGFYLYLIVTVKDWTQISSEVTADTLTEYEERGLSLLYAPIKYDNKLMIINDASDVSRCRSTTDSTSLTLSEMSVSSLTSILDTINSYQLDSSSEKPITVGVLVTDHEGTDLPLDIEPKSSYTVPSYVLGLFHFHYNAYPAFATNTLYCIFGVSGYTCTINDSVRNRRIIIDE